MMEKNVSLDMMREKEKCLQKEIIHCALGERFHQGYKTT